MPVRRELAEGEPFITNSGNYLIDCKFPKIENPQLLGEQIIRVVGVVEHGLFIGIAKRVIVASESGIRVVEKA